MAKKTVEEIEDMRAQLAAQCQELLVTDVLRLVREFTGCAREVRS